MKYLNTLKAEIILHLKDSFSYKVGIFNDILIFGVLYFSLVFMGTGYSLASSYGSTTADSNTLLLIGYVFWSLSLSAINSASTRIASEATKGTLEQKFMAIVPIQWLLLGQFISSITVEVVVCIIISLAAFLFIGTKIIINGTIIISLILTLIGMFGIGLILGAVALKEKKIGNIIFLIQIFLLFVSDTLTTNNFLPNINKVLPLTNGIDVARKAAANSSVTGQDWLILITSSLLWLAVGYIVFTLASRYVKRKGLLSDY
ncbi:MAG: ABC transporter permease [Clostridiales bacterium]|nr:ABC transporter permease [Clostridiales bacterium]